MCIEYNVEVDADTGKVSSDVISWLPCCTVYYNKERIGPEFENGVEVSGVRLELHSHEDSDLQDMVAELLVLFPVESLSDSAFNLVEEVLFKLTTKELAYLTPPHVLPKFLEERKVRCGLK